MAATFSSSRGWVRWAGLAAGVVLVIAVVAFTMRRWGPGSGSQTVSSTSAASNPNIWIEQWRKDAFAGKDPRNLWEQYSKAAQAELDKPGVDPSDIKAKANALGADPQAVFEFMRDQIALEPYVGVLRGARGTLAAGAGNALDRALLAQELLRAYGIESRLVAGKLSDAQVDVLLGRFLDSSPVPKVLADLVGAPDDAALTAEATDLSAKLGVAARNVQELLQHARAKGQEFWSKTDAQRAAQFDFLSGYLRQGGVKTAIDGPALITKLKDRLREHYWLQVKEPNGEWSEFDPTFADAKRGGAYGSTPVVLAEIPKDKYHKLEFSLVYQTLTDGAPKDEVLIAGTFASAGALFEPLEFRIQPTDLGVDAHALAAMSGKQKIDVLRRIKRFQGILRTGSKVTGGRAFDLEGNTYDPSAGPSLKITGGGAFVNALGGNEESTPQFVELRVAMRLTGPDREPMSQIRTLVRAEDLKTPSFAPPILEWQILLQPQWVSAEFVGHRALNQVIATGNALMKESGADHSSAVFEPPPAVPLLVLQMALLRQSAAAAILAKQDGIRALVDEPMLTISGHALSGIQDQEGRITAARNIDIVENGVRYVAKSDTSQPAAFNAALRQGAADGTIEDRFLREAFPATIAQSGTTIFNQAKIDRRAVFLAHTQDIDKLRSAGVTEADIEWIHDNESPNVRLLVATTASGSDAWWSVRPDGNAILRVNGGNGQAMTEYVLPVIEVGLAATCVLEFHHVKSEYEKGVNMSDEDYRRLAICIGATLTSGALMSLGVVFHSLHTISWILAGTEIIMGNLSGAAY